MNTETFNPLVWTSLTPLLGVLVLFLILSSNESWCRLFSLWISCVTFILSVLLWLQFDSNTFFFQYVSVFKWFPYSNFYYNTYIDGISLLFYNINVFSSYNLYLD